MSAEHQDTLAFDCELEQAPAQVWRALTEPALLAQWLMANDFAPEPGHQFTFHEPDAEPIVCTVLEVEEPRLLRLRWREAEQLDSVVTFTLSPARGGGTRLRLVHSGLPVRLRQAMPALASACSYFRCAA